ncbi:MAG TPA: HlyD family efflux transporter periplasmic adaptor subunit [Steroidobacteraceae bacterium]|nr:HlyD family efflux transporter periplasmic adaptor subunit [Steroidobacteraceae bacterium]
MNAVNSGAGTETAAAPAANGRRRTVLTLLAILFVCGGLVWALYWFLVLSKREETDDAYVNGNKVVISARVPGTVIAVLADGMQLVRVGQVLVRLDPISAQINLGRAASALARSVREVRQEQAIARESDAGVAVRRLELARAQADLARRRPLVAVEAIAREKLRHAEDAVRIASDALAQSELRARATHALVDGADVAHNPAVLEAKAAYRDAWIAAERDRVVAPVTGYVAERSVQLGQHVHAGEALMTVIPLNALWIDANFKEGQLRELRIGQPARIVTDLYGGAVVFHGHVTGMSAGTGAAFALLPPQNASGNWIKVVQRVPVRVSIDDADLAKHPLRIGLSATVNVDTTNRGGPVLAPDVTDQFTGVTHVYAADLGKANAQADAVIRRNLPAAR